MTAILQPMPRMSHILALLAAVTLMIGGSPAAAASPSCDPCPPDCAMMQQMAKATANHHGQAPDKGGQAENPCKQGLVCQAPAATAAPAFREADAAFLLSAETVDHQLAAAPAAASHPPDRSLRPPIQL